MNAEIRSLAEEVAVTFESQAAAAHQSLPSSVQLYRTGRVLYSCHTSARGIDDGRSGSLINSFDEMISSLPVKYLQNLLHNLHQAYASLIVSFASTNTSSAASTLSSMIEISSNKSSNTSWKDISEGTESLCGIYLSSLNACQNCYLLPHSSEGGRHALELPIISLSWVYDYISNRKDGENETIADSTQIMQNLIVKTMSRLLVHGIVTSTGKSEEDIDEQLSNIMTLIQNIQSSIGEYNCALGDMVNLKEVELGEQSFMMALCSKFEAKDASQPPQLQYLLAMLRSSPKSDSNTAPSIEATALSSQREDTPQSEGPQQSMTDVQIGHIKSILPDLGEGYTEEALRCYNHDVERTLEALLQASEGGQNIHPRLLTIPTNLPRKLRDKVDHYSANVNLHRGATAKDDGKEHARIQKQRIQHDERQAEEEAFLIDNVSRSLSGVRVSEYGDEDEDYELGNRDEYDDDYDDQYDGIGDDGGMAGGIGGLDEGLYDVDIHNVHQKYDRGGAKNEQEMWKKYNQVIKDVDAESQFWEDNRNMNREGGEEGQQYDKGKGGRAIGPDGKYLPHKRGDKKGRGGGGGGGNNAGRGAGRGGRGGGRGSNATSESKPNQGNKTGDGGDLSKIQKRRKDANKAKVGNHHRKDRANKKAAGGMVM